MNKKKTLDDIFNDDEFSILDSEPTNSNIKSEDERLIESFQINTHHEEKIINDVLNYRKSFTEDWKPYTKEELTKIINLLSGGMILK